MYFSDTFLWQCLVLSDECLVVMLEATSAGEVIKFCDTFSALIKDITLALKLNNLILIPERFIT